MSQSLEEAGKELQKAMPMSESEKNINRYNRNNQRYQTRLANFAEKRDTGHMGMDRYPHRPGPLKLSAKLTEQAIALQKACKANHKDQISLRKSGMKHVDELDFAKPDQELVSPFKTGDTGKCIQLCDAYLTIDKHYKILKTEYSLLVSAWYVTVISKDIKLTCNANHFAKVKSKEEVDRIFKTGDVAECINVGSQLYITVGMRYVVGRGPTRAGIRITNNCGDGMYYSTEHFRNVSTRLEDKPTVKRIPVTSGTGSGGKIKFKTDKVNFKFNKNNIF